MDLGDNELWVGILARAMLAPFLLVEHKQNGMSTNLAVGVPNGKSDCRGSRRKDFGAARKNSAIPPSEVSKL